MTGNREWRRLFVGREEELKRLCDASRKVSSRDGSRPEVQCVVLLAESGFGKTRLVQEFYCWLSRTQDPPTDTHPQAGRHSGGFRVARCQSTVPGRRGGPSADSVAMLGDSVPGSGPDPGKRE